LDERLYVCNYTGCGRAFDNPLRLTDLSRKPHLETYYACPFCFSKVNEAEESEPYEAENEVEHLLEVREGGYEMPIREEDAMKSLKSGTQKELKIATTDLNCPHQVGYLKKRAKDQPVPDSCLTCPKILQCMV
jgi:hypothetical protein